MTFRGKAMTAAEWFSQLQTAEAFWIQAAKETELPEFESTILEYQSQSSTPTGESPDGADDLRGEPVLSGRTVASSKGYGFGLGLEISKALEAL